MELSWISRVVFITNALTSLERDFGFYCTTEGFIVIVPPDCASLSYELQSFCASLLNSFGSCTTAAKDRVAGVLSQPRHITPDLRKFEFLISRFRIPSITICDLQALNLLRKYIPTIVMMFT